MTHNVGAWGVIPRCTGNMHLPAAIYRSSPSSCVIDIQVRAPPVDAKTEGMIKELFHLLDADHSGTLNAVAISSTLKVDRSWESVTRGGIQFL